MSNRYNKIMLVKLKPMYGFTLVELAMVLFIVGLLLGGMLVPLSTRLEQQNRETTNTSLNEIKEVLLGYAVINGKLPCPDCPTSGTSAGCTATSADPAKINDGIEDGVDISGNPVSIGSYVSCATTQGNLPWVTLGTTEFDAWSNHFRYHVTDDFADNVEGAPVNVTPCSNPAADVSFCTTSTGDVDIENVSGTTVTTGVPALVVSFGSNGNVAPTTASEMDNQDGNQTYISNDYINTSGSEFNDMVMWISPNLLMNRMIVSGRLP